MSLFDTGIRPLVDEYLNNKSKEVRDYGDYWSASSAGYCMRKVIFDRLQVPHVKEDARKTRVFEVGNIFHEWMQRITKDAGVSIAQELELIDDKLMIKGHFDDLVKIGDDFILYDYKTQNSRAFTWQKDKGMSHFHKMQLGTYMYMLRNNREVQISLSKYMSKHGGMSLQEINDSLTEARILKISKDDLRMSEDQLMWTPELEKEIYGYWSTLNGYWKAYRERGVLPNCTCDQHENGFMAKEAYNPYWFDGEPCSMKWYELNKESK